MSNAFFLGQEQRTFAFDAQVAPVLEIDPGAVVAFETSEVAYERLLKGESIQSIGLENINAVTGPVFVRGAEPGDVLHIEVLDIAVTRAFSVWVPGFGGLGDKTNQMVIKEIPLKNGMAWISERVIVPIEPMIGCIGVAPAEGKGSTLSPASNWGGNMDLRELSPGATLSLPIQVPGALLSVGDLHAAMGTAEPTFVSLEAAGQATLRLGIEKGRQLSFPRLRLGNNTICVGMGETLAVAQKAALDQAYELLTTTYSLTPFEAYAYASARISMRLGGPASPMVLAVVPDM